MSELFMPGRLTNKQRDLIVRATEFPLQSFRVAVGEWAALNGLIARGLLDETEANAFELTHNGRLVADAIERLRA